jgi:hypothetical protein
MLFYFTIDQMIQLTLRVLDKGCVNPNFGSEYSRLVTDRQPERLGMLDNSSDGRMKNRRDGRFLTETKCSSPELLKIKIRSDLNLYSGW